MYGLEAKKAKKCAGFCVQGAFLWRKTRDRIGPFPFSSMSHSSMGKFLIGLLASITMVVCTGWFFHLIHATDVLAECEGQCEGGGDTPPENPSTPEGSTDVGRSENGGRSGHETVRLQAIAHFVLEHLYPTLQDPTRDRPALMLDETEQAFLCSMARIRQYNDSATRLWFPDFLAELLDRPVAMIAAAMTDERCAQ